jgi:hypothetical protein
VCKFIIIKVFCVLFMCISASPLPIPCARCGSFLMFTNKTINQNLKSRVKITMITKFKIYYKQKNTVVRETGWRMRGPGQSFINFFFVSLNAKNKFSSFHRHSYNLPTNLDKLQQNRGSATIKVIKRFGSLYIW